VILLTTPNHMAGDVRFEGRETIVGGAGDSQYPKLAE
jgi:hypothetical protein